MSCVDAADAVLEAVTPRPGRPRDDDARRLPSGCTRLRSGKCPAAVQAFRTSLLVMTAKWDCCRTAPLTSHTPPASTRL